MADRKQKARLFALPPGVDYPAAFVRGVLARFGTDDPADLACIQIHVNSRRMQRRIMDLLAEDSPRLLPRVDVITDIGAKAILPDLPPPASPLRRRLELTRLVERLIEKEPDLAPRAAAFDLAESLAALMEEMHGEGIAPDALEALDVGDQSGHWQRSLRFLLLVQRFFAADAGPDSELRQRLATEHLIREWQQHPPEHPVLIAGSTGSRGTTRMLMEAVARLEHGFVVLPGFDFDLPPAVWERLDDGLNSQDHPQYRFRALMRGLGLAPGEIAHWEGSAAPPAPARNRLVSLALRPAPVTDAWMEEGPALADLPEACAGLTLLEAPAPRQEALAIALKLRECAETGRTAALITPDRTLTRRVTALLDRWGIEPDDSAGQPLALSPPGRFLRQVAALFGQKITAERLLALLKHPLAASGSEARGKHLMWSRELELHLRRHGPAFPDRASLVRWARESIKEHHDGKDDGRLAWAEWLGSLLEGLDDRPSLPLADHSRRHIALAEALAAGNGGEGSGELWLKRAGEAARLAVDELRREAEHGGEMRPGEYAHLFDRIMRAAEVRDPLRPHPGIMIWGTIEARVQGADLMILAGLNEGIWPKSPAPDPWLNREMRRQAGLLLPDRQIGLSAHDFQQATAGREVILSRSIRDDEAETVPSRWLNRLANLLNGLPANGGRAALEEMRQRGRLMLALAKAFEKAPPMKKAGRPSPRPPVEARPKELPVTRIQTLIRDPYAIYAQYILRLHPLDPLHKSPDPALRGTLLHRVFERFIKERPRGKPPEPLEEARARLLVIAEEVFAEGAPWPSARHLWLARLAGIADDFLRAERARLAESEPILTEKKGGTTIHDLDFTLTARADRIDLDREGRALLYDYKSGKPPSTKQQQHFDKQLPLTAAIIERGGFEKLGPREVRAACYLAIGSAYEERPVPLDDPPLERTWAEFKSLIAAYMRPEKGYTACRAIEGLRFVQPYQHLARFGEWDLTAEAEPEDME